MMDNFTMEISETDFLRVLNRGLKHLILLGDFIDKDDHITQVKYSRRTKRYTLIFSSGKTVQVNHED